MKPASAAWRRALLCGSLLLWGAQALAQSVAQPAPAHYGKPELPPLADPARTLVIVFSHGSGADNSADPCRMEQINSGWGVPKVVHALYGTQVGGLTVLVDGFCSPALGQFNTTTGTGDHKVLLRSRMIEARALAFAAAGVPARQIFLFGHSTGGWASLMVKARAPDAANAVVAFAPAFAGTRATRPPAFRNLREAYAAELAHSARLDALVFAFTQDTYETPDTLAFLTGIAGVELRGFEGGQIDGVLCDGSTTFHGMARNPCFSETQGAVIRAFLERRLVEAGG